MHNDQREDGRQPRNGHESASERSGCLLFAPRCGLVAVSSFFGGLQSFQLRLEPIKSSLQRNNDYIMFGGKFPRLLASQVAGKHSPRRVTMIFKAPVLFPAARAASAGRRLPPAKNLMSMAGKYPEIVE